MRKIVIVGASTGLGRCIGLGLERRGERVAMMARRIDKVEAAVTEAGSGAVAIQCDATDPASCRAAFAAAAEALDGIDTVIYAAAVGPLTKLADATPEQWMSTFETNVVGAANVTQAALAHLDRTAGHVLYMSTVGASYTPPWPGLGVYQVTKAALDRLVESWRAEEPRINFMRVTIGECTGGEGDAQTQFATGWDPAIAMEIAPQWFERKLMNGGFIDIEHLVDMFHSIVESGPSLQMPSLTIIPRPPVAAT